MHYGKYLLRTSQHLTQGLSWYTSQKKNTISWHMNHHYNIVKSTQHGLGTTAEAQSKLPMFSVHTWSSRVQRAGIWFENAKCFSWIFSILLTAMAVWRFRRFNLFLLSYSSLFVSQRLSETCRVGDSQCIRICLGETPTCWAPFRECWIYTLNPIKPLLVGGLEHFSFFHILGIIQ